MRQDLPTSGAVAQFFDRVKAMLVKEFIELRRDRVTLAMIVTIPIMQLVLFGYAINMRPQHLPTALLVQDHSSFSRAFVTALQATGYFDVSREVTSERELDQLLVSGKIQFGVQIPPNFARDMRRGERPAILVIADATNPATIGTAVATLEGLPSRIFTRQLRGPNAQLLPRAPAFDLVVHQRYNPAGKTPLNIVPGLLGVILTMTMLIFTSIAVTREYERGTMEGLLGMPMRPFEIMVGKISPYILVGFVQMSIILLAGHYLFGVPMRGSMALLLALTVMFITANLAIGYVFSTVARTQLQAIQMTFLFFLPNILLSGFAFPFRGMPMWAQYIGEALPLTHYIRIVRGIMLKGAGLGDLAREGWMLVLFVVIAAALAVARFRQTLD